MTRLAIAACVLLAVAFGVSAGAWGQGLLVDVSPDRAVRLPRPIVIAPRPRPQPEASYKIKELAVQARIADQVAKVQVSQSFVNTGSRQMEVAFVFPLPYDGAIDRLTLLIDGTEHPARLLEAKEARSIYESIVRKNQDPALLEWMGTGMFQTSVFPVPPGAERKVTLRYSQLCRKTDGLTDFIFPLSTAKYTSHPVEKVSFEVTIQSETDIKNVYSPSHSIDVKRPDNKLATVAFTSENEIPTSDFRLFYDVGPGVVGAKIVSYRPDSSEEGYFLLLASPQIHSSEASIPNKTVLFVVDRSGSMSGEKMKQAREAAKFVLNNLREGDTFNIIAYDGEVESFRPELERFNDQTRAAALGFIEGLYAGGSTNISGALAAALGQLKDSSRPSFVLFLTDGIPTVGETSESKIVAAAKAGNDIRARVFSFGVGYDVNSRLLDKLSQENFGLPVYVRPNEDIEASVSRLYSRISAPVMTDLAIQFDRDQAQVEQGPAVNRVYPREQRDLFAGEQLVMVGRYRQPGPVNVVLKGTIAGSEQKFEFPATLVESSGDETNAFVEKIWAMRRVGEIIDEIDLKGQNEELVKELVGLATRHGILTPYTSFLAEEDTNLRDLAANRRQAQDRLRLLERAEGQAGFAQRAAKNLYKSAGQQGAAAPAPRRDGSPALEGRALGGAGEAFGAAPGRGFYFDAEKDKVVEVRNMQRVGAKTFFLRDGRWVDSTITEEQEKQAQTIKRFSDEYFELVARLGSSAARYLALEEPVMVELGGQVYAYE